MVSFFRFISYCKHDVNGKHWIPEADKVDPDKPQSIASSPPIMPALSTCSQKKGAMKVVGGYIANL